MTVHRPVRNATAAALLQRFRPYAEYKESGVEWLGSIPAHWKVNRLKHLATLNDEVLPESTHPDLEINYVDIGSVDAVAGITEAEAMVFATAPSRARRLVQDGDVIVSTVRTYLRAIATVRAPARDLVVSTGFAVLRPRRLLSSFASYAVRAPHLVERVVANSVGVGYPAISASSLVCFKVPFPGVGEQQAIADFLDRETARIDALVARKERLIELLKEKRAALITRTVTRGLDPNVSKKYSGFALLGEIPGHWDVKRLGDLTPPDRKIMYGIVLPGPNVDCGVPIVKGGDVAASRLKPESLSKTTFEIESRHSRSRLVAGDLVYAIRGSIGEVEMVPDELEGANLTQDAARIAHTRATNGRWLAYALRSKHVFSQLEAGALGATIKGINIRDLKRARIRPLRDLSKTELRVS